MISVIGKTIRRLAEFWSRTRAIVRFRAHDTTTEQGRSNERYRRMAFTTLATLGSRGIGMLTSLISVPLTFRYLGAERYGLWMVLLSLIGAMWMADLGIGFGVMNAISEAYGKDDRELAHQHVSSGFLLLSGIALILAFGGFVSYPFLPWMRIFNVKSAAVAAEGMHAFVVLFGWFVVNIPLGVIARAQNGLQQGYWTQTVGTIGNLMSLAGLLVVVWLHGSLPWLVLASIFGTVFGTMANGWLLFRKNPWLRPSFKGFRAASAHKIFDLGLMFFVLQVAVTLSFTSDNIVITQVLGAAAVAAYAVPQKLFNLVSQLVTMGTGPLWPAYGEALARGDGAWIRRTFWKSMQVTLAIAVPACTLLVLLGPWAVRVLVGKSLHAALPLLVVLAMWAVVNAASGPISMLLNGSGIIKEQTGMATVASVINLALSIYLTRRFGVMGVCLGSLLTHICIAIPFTAYLIRNLFRSLEQQKLASLQSQPSDV